MGKKGKKAIFSLGPNGPILQIFLVVQYLVGSLKIPLDGSNNLIFLDQVKKHCEHSFIHSYHPPPLRGLLVARDLLAGVATAMPPLLVATRANLDTEASIFSENAES